MICHDGVRVDEQTNTRHRWTALPPCQVGLSLYFSCRHFYEDSQCQAQGVDLSLRSALVIYLFANITRYYSIPVPTE